MSSNSHTLSPVTCGVLSMNPNDGTAKIVTNIIKGSLKKSDENLVLCYYLTRVKTFILNENKM